MLAGLYRVSSSVHLSSHRVLLMREQPTYACGLIQSQFVCPSVACILLTLYLLLEY